MGLTIFENLPITTGGLVRIDNLPVGVTPDESFYRLRGQILALVEHARALASIRTDVEYDQGLELIKGLNLGLKAIEAGMEPAKREANGVKERIMVYQHELDLPANEAKENLSTETGRYSQDRERRRREEEDRLRREAEFERQRKQREADLNALTLEIWAATQCADVADQRGEPETALEIRQGLRRWASLEGAPGAFHHLLGDATAVRSLVALAAQHESARIAVAKARAAGDKATARKIEQASARLEAPIVAPVISERIEAAPVVVPKAELKKAKGGYVDEWWEVDTIFDPSLVPIDFRPCCEHCISALNAHAGRVGAAVSVPGVAFKKMVKTKGVRASA